MSLLRLRGKRRVGWSTLGVLVTAWFLLALQPCAAALATSQAADKADHGSDCPDCIVLDVDPDPHTGCGERLCHLENPVSATSPEKTGSGSVTAKFAPAIVWLLPPPLAAPILQGRTWHDTAASLPLAETPRHLLHCVFLD